MKNQRKRRKLFKRLISGVSAIALSVGLLGSIPASADDSTVGYKYTLFAYSSEDGAISSSAANFCVNGNIATNGTISAGQNFNVNGEKKEHANEAMPDLTKNINEKFFTENVDVKAENYKNEEVNINVASPLDVKGKAELNGNIKLAAGIKAMGDIVLAGGVLNNDSTVLFSENGSININSENVSLTGLIYAPKGNIVIESKSLNLNSVVMIANKITLNAPNININNSASMAKFVQESIDKNGNSSSGDENEEDPEPVTDPAIYAYGEYNEETKSVDIEWYSNVTGEFAVLESLNGTDYTVVSKVSDDTKYSIKVASDFIKKFYKVTTIKDGKTIESIPFAITKATGKYTTELLDTDKDGLADLYEEMLGTDKTLPDTDKDGLTDYEEVYITSTDPTKYDSVTEGVSDANADSDKDGLTNKREIELKTDPNSDDTDGDNLKDGDELSKYNTDPTKKDTDGDELEDDDELKFKYDPNKKDTDNNGIVDGKEKHQQTLDVVPDNKEQAVTKVSVSMAATGNVEKTTTIESIMGKDVLCSNVVGLVGEPFSIESKSSFDKATITFTVDKTKLGETEFDNLMFLWYDRENDNFVELETSHDAANSSVSIETTHFSEYMIVDSKKWFDNWRQIESDRKRMEQSGTGSSIVHVVEPTATVVLSHCSDDSDPNFLNPDEYSSVVNHYTNYRTLICEHLIDSMNVNDVFSFERFQFDLFHQSTPKITRSLFYNDKDFLKKEISYYSTGYYVDNDITLAMRFASTSLVNDDAAKDKSFKRIVCITDKDLYVDTNKLISYTYQQSNGLDYYKIYKSVPIYFAYIGDIDDNKFEKLNLHKIAAETGGKVYKVATLNELYSELGEKNHVSNVQDYDKDGFSDMEETYGLIVDSSGTRYKTKLDKDDSDDDGLKDNEEVDVNRIYRLAVDRNGDEVWKCFHTMRSIPTEQDSDGDGIKDKKDPYPLKDFGLVNYKGNERKWFQIVNSMNHIPSLDSITYVKEHQDEWYENLYKERYPNLWGHEYKTSLYILELKALASAISGLSFVVNGYLVIDDLFVEAVNLLPNVHFESGRNINNSCFFLYYYLHGFGGTVAFDATYIINKTNRGKALFNDNVATLKSACEKALNKGESCIISSTNNAGFIGWERPNSNTNLFFSPGELDSFLGLNNCNAGMVANCTYDGESYNAVLNYYILDYYDFYEMDPLDGKEGFGPITNDDYVLLAMFDDAKPFDVVGGYSVNISWEKGSKDTTITKVRDNSSGGGHY